MTEHVNDVDLMTQLADMRVHAEQNTEFVDLRMLLPSSASKQTVHHFIERAHDPSYVRAVKSRTRFESEVHSTILTFELPFSTNAALSVRRRTPLAILARDQALPVRLCVSSEAPTKTEADEHA